MSTTISTISSDGDWTHWPPDPIASVDWDLRDERDPGDEAIPGATEGVGATPAQQCCGGSGMAASFGPLWRPENRRSQRCVTHHNACDCREAKHADELAALRDRVAEAEHGRDVAVATLSEQLDAANRTWSVRVSVPDEVDHHSLIGTTLVDIGHSDRVYIVESDEISRAFAERDAANARVATLEADAIGGEDRLSHEIALLRTRVATLEGECLAVRLAQQAWDVLCSDRCPEDQDALQAECKRLDDAADAARAATGPIGGVA